MTDRHAHRHEGAAEGETAKKPDRGPAESYSAAALAAWRRVTRFRFSDTHIYRRQATALREHASQSGDPDIRSRLLAIAETYEGMAGVIEQAMRSRPWRVAGAPQQ